MKTELLAQTRWRGKLNDRVISPAFRALEGPHYTPLTPIAAAIFDILVTRRPRGIAGLAGPSSLIAARLDALTRCSLTSRTTDPRVAC
jgi:hypothetical protein